MNPFLLALLFFLSSPSLASAHAGHGHLGNYYQMPSPQFTFVQEPSRTPAQQQPTLQPLPPTQPASARPQRSTTQAQPMPDSGDFAAQVAADVFAYTNQQRESNGLAPLTQESTLTSIAQAHSADMLANNYFTHNDLQGCSPSCRLTNAGYSWQAMGENIYEMSGYNLDAAGTANQIVQGWMNSPEHRANILNTSYTETGVGIAVQGSTVYATSDYAKPRS